jgi:hypothetical protein
LVGKLGIEISIAMKSAGKGRILSYNTLYNAIELASNCTVKQVPCLILEFEGFSNAKDSCFRSTWLVLLIVSTLQ